MLIEVRAAEEISAARTNELAVVFLEGLRAVWANLQDGRDLVCRDGGAQTLWHVSEVV